MRPGAALLSERSAAAKLARSMDIGAGIAAATQTIGIAKRLRGIEKSYDAATYKAQWLN